jgi:hypothetical protein
MARRTAEIQADIAVTRRLIEQQLDAIGRRLPRTWWIPYALVAGAFVGGLALSRVPLLVLVSAAARTAQTGITVATTLAAIDRFVARRRAA